MAEKLLVVYLYKRYRGKGDFIFFSMTIDQMAEWPSVGGRSTEVSIVYCRAFLIERKKQSLYTKYSFVVYMSLCRPFHHPKFQIHAFATKL
jgi:hypothetical protein